LSASLELRHLRFAVAAAHHGSFRRAADALRVRQSTLSRSIRQMEDRLGVLVFERSSGGVRLTTAGKEILQTSRQLIDGLEQMTATAKATGRGEAGRLTIGFYTSLSAGNLRACLIEYARRFPEVDIRTIEGTRAALLTALERGALDIAIATGELSAGNCAGMALWSERIMVALPESHRLAGNNIVYWTDLRDEKFLLSQHDPGPEIQDILLAKLVAPGERPEVVRHNVSRENIKSLVGAGFGVSLMCEACIGAKCAGVVYREARDGSGPSRIGYAALWRSDNNSQTLANFIKLLEERHPSCPTVAAMPAVPSRMRDRSP
jgi:DNA-binding transcriptional LysR family regulator